MPAPSFLPQPGQQSSFLSRLGGSILRHAPFGIGPAYNLINSGVHAAEGTLNQWGDAPSFFGRLAHALLPNFNPLGARTGGVGGIAPVGPGGFAGDPTDPNNSNNFTLPGAPPSAADGVASTGAPRTFQTPTALLSSPARNSLGLGTPGFAEGFGNSGFGGDQALAEFIAAHTQK